MDNKNKRKPLRPDFIKNRAEYARTFTFLVNTTVDVMKISEQEAGLRVARLMKTDVLEGDHNDPFTQWRIDKFLAIPSRDHALPLPFLLQSGAYRDALIYTLTNPEVVEQYERVSRVERGQLAASKLNECLDIETGKLTGPIAEFEKFFRRSIWVRFQDQQRKGV